MSVDKQQTWAEAVVECVLDEKERLRLLNLYEPDELAAALLRQVAIANALRSSLTCCEEERRLEQEEVRNLQAEVERLRESADTAIGYLKDIGDWAHGRSAGPTIQDDMWTIRRMAYDGMDAAREPK